MTVAVPKIWISVWQAPYRPLFLLAGLWALVAPAVWLLPEGTGPEPIAWHRHELLFGMTSAAAGGYLLTALPSWTKSGPVPSAVTLFVTCLWCAARLTAVFSDHLPFVVAAVGASAYFVCLTVILTHAVVSSGAWHRLWAPLAMAALGANALSLVAQGVSIMSTPLLYIVLIILVGGRAVPAFTRRWLDRTGAGPLRDRPALSYLATAGVLATASIEVFRQHPVSGYVLMFSGVLLALQITGWQSVSTYRYPALFMLHLAFAWTPAGLILTGLAAVSPDQIAPAAALHALTMGAMGTMMAAIMMRSAMRRDGAGLIANGTMACAIGLVSLSALLRVLAGLPGEAHVDAVVAAAICWMAAWTLFLVAYIPALMGPVPRPVFSAAIGDRAERIAPFDRGVDRPDERTICRSGLNRRCSERTLSND
ncbi:NnrS family protein [Ensifer sp. IC3342]|nr:NnrS family protein [Ensifer sp. BRP08]MCA1449961.1 NnrS family protein [Ensifer sp. IC3342]